MQYNIFINVEGKEGASGPLGRVGGALQSVAEIAGGIIGADLFERIAQGFSNLVRGAINTTAELQRVGVMLESLAAKELKASGAVDTVTEGLQRAGPIANALMGEIRKLSLISPFPYQSIIDVFRMNMAFGQSSQMALKLTGAITDMAAAMGLDQSFLQRIAYNFSQMSLVGKITSRDLRDLGMAGVDLNAILEEQLGGGIEYVNGLLEQNKLTMEDVSQAFVDYATANFGGAAQRLSRTFDGLKSSFSDLFTFISVDTFGPALQTVSDYFAGILDSGIELVESGKFQEIGMMLNVVVEEFIGFAKKAGPSIMNFFADLGNDLADTATKAFDWGANIAIQLASGIIEGASTALSAAMDFISGMLSFFLAPGSPPKVAPDLPDWGASAMTEFLRGFAKADFKALDAIQNPLKTVLNNLSQTRGLDKSWVSKMFSGFSQQIASVLAGDGSLDKLLGDMRKKLGGYGNEIAKLAESQIKLSLAEKAQLEIEKQLEAARDRSAKATDKISELVDEYNQRIRAGESADSAGMKDLRDQIDGQESIRDAANEEADTLDKKLEDQKSIVEALQEQADLQNSLMSNLLEMDQLDLAGQLEGLTSAIKGMAGGGAGGGLGGLFDQMKEGMETKLEEIKENMKTKFAEAIKPLKDVWDKEVIPAWNRVKKSWDNLMKNIKAVYDKYIQPIVDWIGELLPDDFVKNIGWAIGVVGGLSAAFSILSTVAGVVVAIIAAINWPLVLLIGAIALLKTAWDNNWGGMRDKLTEFWEGTAKPFLEELVLWFQENIPIAIQTVTTWWNETLIPALQAAGDWINNNLLPIFQSIYNFFTVTIPEGIATLKAKFDEFSLALNTIWTFIEENYIPVWQSLIDVFTALRDYIADNLQAAFQILWDEVLSPFYDFLSETVAPFLYTVFNAAFDILVGLITTLKECFDAFWKATIKPFYDFLKDTWSTFWTNIFVAGFSALKEGIGWVIDKLVIFKEWLDAVADAIRNFPTIPDLVGHSPSPLAVGVDYANRALANMKHRVASVGNELARQLAPDSANMSLAFNNMADGGYTSPYGYQDAPQNIEINIEINVENISSDQDVEELAYKVADVINDKLRR